MEHIFEIFSVSRETTEKMAVEKGKAEKTGHQTCLFRLWMWV